LDIARAPKRKTGRYIAWGIGGVFLIVGTIIIVGLKPAAPSVDRSVVIIDSVRRGDMVREVRGTGTLVPVDIIQVPAQSGARVDKLDVQSGQVVKEGDVLLEMSSPDAEIQAIQADQSLSQARSTLITTRSQLRQQILTQQNTVATAHTNFVKTTQDAEAADTLARQGLAASFDVANAHAAATEATERLKNEKQLLTIMQESADSQLAALQTNIDELKGIADFYHAKLRSLTLRAPGPGVVQGLALQPGQYVTEGTLLLKIVQPGKLKATLQIPEAEAADVQIGQSASVDTRSKGVIPGHVSRKDPSANQGTVGVDVVFDAPLPAGAVPDLSVDGTIEIEKLHNVLSTGRPAYGNPTGLVGLFKLVDNGKYAERVQVLLGKSSVTSVEIQRGLAAGDKVILSDMSDYDGVDRVRLK
jgi:HlyD family secretion protein